MKYEIKVNQNSVNPEVLCASKASIAYKSLACDELKIHSKNSSLANFGDFVEVLKDNVRIFAGVCFSKTNSENAKSAETIYIFKNAWLDLMEIPFMQEWNAVNLDSESPLPVNNFKTRTVFGADKTGKKIPISTQLVEVLNYAKQYGANIDFCLGEFSTEIPNDEESDMTCDEALKRILRWSPDAVSYFDYTSEIPVLHIKKRSELETFDVSNFAFKNLSYSSREDLKVENVCVIYEKKNSDGGQTFEAFTKDVYPKNANAGGKKSLVMSVQLGGYSCHVQNQKITTENIDVKDNAWWVKRIPFLSDTKITKFNIKNVRRNSSLPRELKSGNISEWMLKSLEYDRITCEVEYEMGDERKGVKTFSLKLLATDASTQNYSRLVYSSLEESTPKGLAQAIYEATNVAITQGSAQFICGLPREILGKNISWNGKFENAIVASLNLNLVSGFASVEFGAPSHLYPSDLAQLFRINRSRKVSESNARVQPKARGLSIDSSENLSDSHIVEVGDVLSRFIVKDPIDPDSKSISIDIGDIDEEDSNVKLKLRKIVVCENGEAKYAYVLMSNTF